MRVIFDFDGTLIAQDRIETLCFSDACAEVLGVKSLLPNWSEYGEVTDLGIVRGVTRRHLGREVRDQELDRFVVAYARRLARAVREDATVFRRLVPGAASFLREARVRYGVGIATGNVTPAVEVKVAASGIDLSGIPVTTAEHAPSRSGLLTLCASRIGGSGARRTVAVGDGVWDVQAARAVGFAFVGVAGTEDARRVLRAAGADTVISDFTNAEQAHRALLTASVPG